MADHAQLLFRLHAGPLHHFVGHVNRNINPHCQGDGITGPAIDFQRFAVGFQHDFGEKCLVLQITDNNVRYFAVKGFCNLAQQVVSHWSYDFDALQLYRDGISFKRANPDGEIPFAAFFAQDYDPVLGHQTYAYAIDYNLYHSMLLYSIC